MEVVEKVTALPRRPARPDGPPVHTVFFLRPWSSNVGRSLLKEPKVYSSDWSGVAERGARLDFWQDQGLGEFGLWYRRDKEGHEADFLVSRDGGRLSARPPSVQHRPGDAAVLAAAGVCGPAGSVQERGQEAFRDEPARLPMASRAESVAGMKPRTSITTLFRGNRAR
jgi:hypothetical protein